jgi:hypothetical protein
MRVQILQERPQGVGIPGGSALVCAVPGRACLHPLAGRFPSTRLRYARSVFALPLFGVFDECVGVSEHPEVQCIDLHQVFRRMQAANAYSDPSKPATVAVVLASDGIWDNWTYEDVTAFVVNPELRSAVVSEGKSDDDVEDRGVHLRHTKAVSKALIDSNAVHANRNFGNQADNATGIVLLLHCEDCVR